MPKQYGNSFLAPSQGGIPSPAPADNWARMMNRQPAAGGGAPAGGNSQVNQSGRYNRDPGTELARLLDVLEEERRRLQGNISGISPNYNQQDLELMQKMQEAALAPGLARISGAAGARGITGSSIEGVERGQFAANVGLQGMQMLQEQGFRRAGLDLSKNQLLFNSLIGTLGPQLDVSGGLAQESRQKDAQGGGNWLGRLGRAALGAGVGFATGGPMGALAGGAAGLTGGSPQDYNFGTPTPSYYNYNQADFSSQNPLEWSGPRSVRP